MPPVKIHPKMLAWEWFNDSLQVTHGEAARSFHESMLALAVLDLPFTAPKHETKIDGCPGVEADGELQVADPASLQTLGR